MALLAECPRCKRHIVVDTCCGGYCCECIDKHDDLNHSPNCRIAIIRRIDKTRRLAQLHELLDKQEVIYIEAYGNAKALQETLREISPCPKCGGTPTKKTCPNCNGKGYKPKPTEEELNEEYLPATY